MMLAVMLLSFLAWCYLICFRGWFWHSRPDLADRKPTASPRVAILVPARNEEASLRQALTSLLAQQYEGEMSIYLVNDNSTDATGAIAAELAASNARLQVIAGQPLPDGWSGKLWALHQGIQQASLQKPAFFLLTDADIVHEPDHLARLVAKAESGNRDLVSCMVQLHCKTTPEKLLIPAFIFFFQMLYPFRWVNDDARRTAGAAGGTILVARPALEHCGGVEAIRHHLIDDCALAAAVQSVGGRIWLGHTDRARSLRIYKRSSEIWDMIARTAFVQLNHSLILLTLCTVGMAMLYLLPPVLAIASHGVTRGIAFETWLLMAVAYQPSLSRYGLARWWSLLLPFVALYYMAATLDSALRHFTGQGGGWKNRVYPKQG